MLLRIEERLLMGRGGLIKAIINDGVEVGVCSRRSDTTLWSIYRGVPAQFPALVKGITGLRLKETVRAWGDESDVFDIVKDSGHQAPVIHSEDVQAAQYRPSHLDGGGHPLATKIAANEIG